jgi:tetratricopeptide (TPR) repeat protein
VGWGLNSFFTGGAGYGYGATYVNPYYAVPATTVAVPTAQVAPYDYSQPVIVNNYVTTENTSQGSQADSSATGGASTATQTQETNPAFKKFDDGLALFKTGKYSDSLGSFTSALKDMPGDPVIHEVRALTLFATGDYGQAAAALNSLLASAPGMDWTTLSGLYGNVDDYTGQLRKLEAHCKANPKDAAAHFVLAYHYLVIGSKDSAISALKVVVANQPQDVTAKRMLDALSPPEPKEDSATQARSAEPVAAEADSKPAEGDAKPEPETDLVGTWTATAGKSNIELSITEDSKFVWKATEADKVVAELKGDLVAAGDAISLDTPDKGSMAGSVVSGGADQWTFIPPGAPADAGLKFNRKK